MGTSLKDTSLNHGNNSIIVFIAVLEMAPLPIVFDKFGVVMPHQEAFFPSMDVLAMDRDGSISDYN